MAMLYLHPWEFDPDQVRLPLDHLNRFRTYVGLTRTRGRLKKLLLQNQFVRAVDLVAELSDFRDDLPDFHLVAPDRDLAAQCA
jgi:hypothetical protein